MKTHASNKTYAPNTAVLNISCDIMRGSFGKLNGALYGSVCMQVMVICICDADIRTDNFQSVFPQDTHLTFGLNGSLSYNTQNIDHSVLLTFLQEESAVQDNACPNEAMLLNIACKMFDNLIARLLSY